MAVMVVAEVMLSGVVVAVVVMAAGVNLHNSGGCCNGSFQDFQAEVSSGGGRASGLIEILGVAQYCSQVLV
jgi:uncharacterized protein (DUF779 family)